MTGESDPTEVPVPATHVAEPASDGTARSGSYPANDPWSRFRSATRARIGLPRTGDSLATRDVLELQLAHARARDAVHGRVDFDAIAAALAPLPTLRVHSAAPERVTYLSRPDLGRKLSADSAATLEPGNWDVVFIVADGLSAAAVEKNAVPTVKAAMRRLGDLSIAPVVLAEQSRVALGDDIGERIGARLAVIIVGERPGLSVPDSLGAYLTFGPKVGRLDSERNCISNIHPDGLSYEAAADKIAWLAREALRLGLTGVDLKEDAEALAGPSGTPLPQA